MTYKSYFLILALLFCTTIARAQYNQMILLQKGKVL